MIEFFKALITRFEADPMSGSLTALYNTEAPASAVFPYAVFTLITDMQDDTFSEKYEELLVQFDIYSKDTSVTEVMELFELLKGNRDLDTGFDYCILTVTGYAMLKMEREIANLVRWEVNGTRCWDMSVTYRVMLKKA